MLALCSFFVSKKGRIKGRIKGKIKGKIKGRIKLKKISNKVVVLDIKMSNPFLWDGTSLGYITDSQIEEKYILDTVIYWKLRIDKFETICIARTTKDYTTCIIDELKPLFGLVKLGTHYAKYKSQYVILIRSRFNIKSKEIVNEITLENYKGDIDQFLTNKIKRIYVFRDLLCLNKSSDKSLILRQNVDNDELFIVSFFDGLLKINKLIDINRSTYLPETVFKKWMQNESPSDLLVQMLKIHSKNSINSKIFNMRPKIVKILNRISGDSMIGLADIIITRICNKLEFYAAKKDFPIEVMMRSGDF